jgi:hypothetical protein
MPPQPAPLILFVDNDAQIGELGAIILNPAGHDVVILGKLVLPGSTAKVGRTAHALRPAALGG